MKTMMKAAVACSLLLQCFGATISYTNIGISGSAAVQVATTTVVPSTCGTGLITTDATLTGVFSQPLINGTIQIVGYVGSLPFLSLQQDLCGALQNTIKQVPLQPTIELLSTQVIQPTTGVVGSILGGVGSLVGGLLNTVGTLLVPNTGLSSGLYAYVGAVVPGTVQATAQVALTTATQVSALPVLGPLLQGVLGTVSQLVTSVLDLVIGLLRALPVVASILDSVVLTAADEVLAHTCPVLFGSPSVLGNAALSSNAAVSSAATLKLKLKLPVPTVPVSFILQQVPKISFFVYLTTFIDGSVQQVLSSKIVVSL